ncbi:substrate-binding domain-containing protein [Cognatishimia sp.]|uniref:substrate-binding domain-containing protein n=1 Tax=Cognatishimia sp. TaxID=2211648 RepID=UPI00351888B8
MKWTALPFFLTLSSISYSDEMTLAVTTSFHNSGLSDVLLPEIKSDLDLDVHLLVVGTGQALRLGASGDVDAILVHSKSAEEAFVDSAAGTHRTEIMYNDFVIVGPQSDPATLSDAASAKDALAAIQASGALFVSRGDDSGTHKKERALWAEAGFDPSEFKAHWYREVGSGMGASLNTASAMNAYILTDRASWLKFGNKGDLEIQFQGDAALFNQYAYLPVNAATFPHVNAEDAARLEAWLTSDAARDLIDGYRLNGEVLFTFNTK